MISSLSNDDRRKNIFAACILAVFAAICFLPSLSVGFISDDKQQFAYIWHYLQAQPFGLLKNFVSVWMQEPIWGIHYRPMMIFPLSFDVLVWNKNAAGWHVTTVLMHVACTVLIYFISKRVLQTLAGAAGVAIPFLAAALFAVHPLHAESVTWLCGRVDTFCTLFYLSSVLSFLLSFDAVDGKSKRLRLLSMFFCACSLFTKEVGASLPAVLTWYLICRDGFGAGPGAEPVGLPTFVRCTFNSFKATAPFWILFIVFLGVRAYSLGTLFGGYEGFASVAIGHIWFAGVTQWKFLQGVFFPIPIPQQEEMQGIAAILTCLYGTMIVTAAARFGICRDWRIWRPALFLFGWLTAGILLVMRVWYAASVLPGGRHFYLVSVPFSILLTLLVVPTAAANSLQRKVRKLAVGILSIFCLVLGFIAIKSHDVWIDELRNEDALEAGIVELARQHPEADRLVFIAPPQTRNHIALYPSFANLQGCLKAPLCTPDLSQKIGSLRSHFFNYDLVNKSELVGSLRDPRTVVFGWDGDSRKVCPISAERFAQHSDGTSKDREVKLTKVEQLSRGGVSTYALAVDGNSFKEDDYDCIDITVETPMADDESASMLISWNQNEGSINNGVLSEYEAADKSRPLWRFDQSDGYASKLSCFLKSDGKPHTYRFHLSELASWILFGKLSQMQVVTPANAKILSARFVNLDGEIPKISAPPQMWTREQSGAWVPKSKDSLILNFDATKISGAHHVMVEISKPFEYFEYFIPGFRQCTMSTRSLKKYALEGLLGEMTLWAEDFKVPGEYDVRVAAFDKDGRLLGYVSDPITIRI